MYRILLTGLALTALVATATAQQPQPATAAGRAAARAWIQRATPNVLPGTPDSAFGVIQGNALDSTNGQMADSLVRLRDARTGRIADTQVTDRTGLFAFRGLDPGTYIAEIVGNDQTVLAASQILTVDGGQTVSTLVRLPLRVLPLGGIFGHGTSAAAAIATAAAASGVLSQTPTANDISPK